MTRIALVLALTACTASQSARVLAPGKTQVTAAINRNEVTGDTDSDAIWSGEVMVRHGLGDRFDGGLRVARTPGRGEAVSLAQLEPKVQVTAADAATTLALALGLGLAWGEQGSDFEDGTYVIAPTVFVGHALSPTAELVFAPKLSVIKPDGSSESLTGVGAALGVRVTDPARSWAVHPELLVQRISDDNDSETFVTLGLGVSVGN